MKKTEDQIMCLYKMLSHVNQSMLIPFIHFFIMTYEP